MSTPRVQGVPHFILFSYPSRTLEPSLLCSTSDILIPFPLALFLIPRLPHSSHDFLSLFRRLSVCPSLVSLSLCLPFSFYIFLPPSLFFPLPFSLPHTLVPQPHAMLQLSV